MDQITKFWVVKFVPKDKPQFLKTFTDWGVTLSALALVDRYFWQGCCKFEVWYVDASLADAPVIRNVTTVAVSNSLGYMPSQDERTVVYKEFEWYTL